MNSKMGQLILAVTVGVLAAAAIKFAASYAYNYATLSKTA